MTAVSILTIFSVGWLKNSRQAACCGGVLFSSSARQLNIFTFGCFGVLQLQIN